MKKSCEVYLKALVAEQPECGRGEYGKDLGIAERELYILSLINSGLVPVWPEPDELQLDIDSVVQYYDSVDRFRTFQSNLSVPLPKLTVPSKSWRKTNPHGNVHIYIKLPFTVTELQRIALQASFGSDGVREMLSMIRLFNGVENSSLMAETERAYGQILEWRKYVQGK